MSKYDYAKLCPIDVTPFVQDGQAMFFVRDPLALSPHVACIPQSLGLVLALCDGQKTVEAMQKIMAQQTGTFISSQNIENLLGQLDKIYILDNDRSNQIKAKTVAQFRALPYRASISAAQIYAADPNDLRRELQGYLDQSDPIEEIETSFGLISPHIDYGRGGLVYARVWKRAANLAREAECVVVFGTDHHSMLPSQITLTRQNYATPFGILPTDQESVDALVNVLGEEAAFAAELHRRQEWSIELVLTWRHFIRQGEACPIVPILCGSFQHFIWEKRRPADDQGLRAVIEAVKQTTANKRPLVVASGDLAHLGPVFGTSPIRLTHYAQIQTDDDCMLAPIYAGDPDAFFEVIRHREGKRNVCGTASFYLALKLMGQVKGEGTSYDRCPADLHNTSYVSVCGVVFC